jgi:hypothetical protein
MLRTLKLYSFFAISAFLLGVVGYLILHKVMPHGLVFLRLYRMFNYHALHPFQYVAVVALTYGIIATPCALWWHPVGWRRFAMIFYISIATVLVASIPGGVLWKIHDMQEGSFTTGARFWKDLLWGASTGLRFGWQIIAISFPYNILGLIFGFVVTHFGFKIAAKQ